MSHHRKEQQILQAQHNSLPPIFRIPNEMLISIFMIIVDHTADSKDMIPLTHVCQHWRQVSLEASVLWSFINITSSRFLPEICTRSQQAPITVYIILNDETPSSAVKFLLENALHLRVLDVAYSEEELAIVKILLRKRCPLLQILRLIDEGSRPSRLPDLLGRHASTLRQLSLSGVFIETLSSLTQLTHLEVWDDPEFDPLPALKNMPRLEVMGIGLADLRDCPATYDGTSVKTADIINLPYLRSATLHGFIRDCAYVMDHINFPSSACIDLHTTMNEEYLDERVTKKLLQFLGRHTCDHTRDLRVAYEEDGTCFVEHKFKWCADGMQDPVYVAIALEAIARMTRFKPFKLAILSSFAWDTYHDWFMLHRVAKEATSLEVYFESTVLDSLALNADNALSAGDPDNAILPNLNQLSLLVMEDVYDSEDSEDRFDWILEMFRVRKKLGLPILRLKVKFFGESVVKLSEKELEELGVLVEVIVG